MGRDYEDLYLAEILLVKDAKEIDVNPGDYAVFHAINGTTTYLTGLNYAMLGTYLMGATQGKSNEEIGLTNGPPEEGKNSWSQDFELVKINRNELEKLLKDTHLDERFSFSEIR